MKLTEEQKGVLEGERGKLLARYLEWSILWGEALGATRLVPVTNVHCILRTPSLAGISERTLDTYLDEFRELCSNPVQCITLTHANCTDLAALREKGLTNKELDFQRELHALASGAGVRTTWSCAPYQVGAVPGFGEICAWTESSAVVYSNSMLGARTNRNGMESSLAAAFLGWVPEFGALLDRNRKARIRVEMQVEMKSVSDWGALGYSDICPGALGHARPRNYVSNSFKQAFYGRSALASRTGVLPLEGCIEAAVTGRWLG